MRTLRKRKLFGALLLVGFAVALVTTSGLVLLHDEILNASFERRDVAVESWAHGFTNPMLTEAMEGLSWIGSPIALVPIITVAVALMWRLGRRDNATVVAAAALGGVALDEVMKWHFKRLRPDVPWAFVHEHSFSFPSGHSVLAIVMYGVIVYKTQDKLRSLWARAALVAGAALMVAGIGFSRVYLGAHFPSDVAGGYFVGAVWLAAVIGSDQWIRAQRR
ncbi:phosphatase PAP2 family protein [Occallatibacter savannae]|uniref:phosphatase PAP2 family protein n=1 Tax=Occallatibacter savannae TaxID=1002691 RepID=UPI0013A5AFCE|nr:phosphatase PAP2 family protein [Occallatibacter savannae]